MTRAFEGARESDGLAWKLLEDLADGLWYWDVTNDVVRWSDGLFRILGYPESEWTVGDIFDLTHPDDLDAHRDAVATHLEAETDYRLEVRIRTYDGDYCWFDTHGVSVRGDDGRATVMMGFVRDISEQMLRRGKAEAAEALFLAFAEACPAPVFIKNPEGVHIFANRAADSLLGKTVTGLTNAELFDPETAAEVSEVDRSVLESGEMHQWFGWLDFTTGGRVWTHDVKFPVYLSNGSVALGGFGFDLTELKEAQIREAREERMASLGKLAAGIAHDFNNCLMLVQGFSNMAARDLDGTSPAMRNLKQVEVAVEKGSRLVESLMGFARQQPMEPVLMDLGEHVEGGLPLLEQLAGPGVELVFSRGGTHDRIRIDPAQVDQILTNLVANARDAIRGAGEGQGTVRIEVGSAADQEGQWVTLLVRDDGPGIPSEMTALVFEPFFTTKPKGKGSGMGLATVDGIVRQNAGRIEILSPAEGGTGISIHLPMVPKAGTGGRGGVGVPV